VVCQVWWYGNVLFPRARSRTFCRGCVAPHHGCNCCWRSSFWIGHASWSSMRECASPAFQLRGSVIVGARSSH
jgi:hypothetical protein